MSYCCLFIFPGKTVVLHMNNLLFVVASPEILEMSSFQYHRMDSASAVRILLYMCSYMHECKYILRRYKMKERAMVSVLTVDVGLRQ